MTDKQFIRVLKKALKTQKANDLFILMKAFRYFEFDSWEVMEEICEKVTGERPDYYKCKKIMRQQELI